MESGIVKKALCKRVAAGGRRDFFLESGFMLK